MAWTTIQFVFGLVHRYQVSIEGLDTCQIHVFLADLRSHMSGRVCYPIRLLGDVLLVLRTTGPDRLGSTRQRN